MLINEHACERIYRSGSFQITMPNRIHFVRQTAAVLMACVLIASLLSGFAAAQGGANKQPLT